VTAPAFVGLASEVAAATGCRVGVLAEVAPSSRALDVQTVPDAIAFVLHTSGTTGSPKAIPCRQDRLAERVRVNASALSMRAESVFASPSPFHHIAVLGNHAVALAIGAAVAPMPRFDVAEWRALARAQTTHVLLVPTVIEMLLEAGALDALPTLQVLQYGASPIEPETLRRVLDVLPSVKPVQMFGQTEGSPITCLTPDDHRRALDGEPHLLRSVGRAAPGAEVRIDEPDDAGIGEICARAPHFFGADPDGWVRTGDLGHLDDLGYLFLAGRKADMVIRGGENVYPVEVEQVLLEHPAVRDVAVVGRPDALLGEVLKAYVVPADDSSLPSADELHAFARKSLAGFKVPAAWEFIDELPRNAAGKVLRRELVERPVD
jgi:acyl-CoA synthetase (AMP-forming)/AMP-acid ligase II